jgi:hypothetical protein
MDLTPLIYQKEDFLHKAHLKKMLEYFKSVSFQDAIIMDKGGSVDKNVRSTMTTKVDRDDERLSMVHWYNFLHFSIKKELPNYAKTVGIADLPVDLSWFDINVLKYEKDDFYKYHVDHAAACPRSLSIIHLLNDDYEGGELCFTNPSGSEEYMVETKANKIIIWPSNFLFPHSVKPVLKGTRYTIVAWVR